LPQVGSTMGRKYFVATTSSSAILGHLNNQMFLKH